MDEELEAFKTLINLSEYAASQGFVLDKKASSRNSIVMTVPGGDKIVIARGQDLHWLYFSVHQDHGGTILDFVQHLKGCRLGGARQELRYWSRVGQYLARPHPDLFRQEIQTLCKDRAQVLRDLWGMKDLSFHHYLEQVRCIPRSLLHSARFAGKILIDARANAIFPHSDADGPCGYEMKNRGFTGFSKGGEKGLWFSAVRRTDAALVISESGIDALSYAVLHANENARYASTAGALNPNQSTLIAGAIAKMGEGASIRIATDNDEGGRQLAVQIGSIAAESGRTDLSIVKDLPAGEGTDWNDSLRARTADTPPEPGPR